MTPLRWTVIHIVKLICRIICRVDASQLTQIPHHGPLILVCNHINWLEVPLLFSHLQPRPVTGFAKIETWDNPFLGWLFDLWGAIPLRRGETDMQAIRQALQSLKAGYILAIAPEGTRSYHGRLQNARAGLVTLALHSEAPLLPLVYYGGENIDQNLKKLRRTDFKILVGKPFFLHAQGQPVSRKERQKMIDEVMYQLAALLPPDYRGEYANLANATTQYLSFITAPA